MGCGHSASYSPSPFLWRAPPDDSELLTELQCFSENDLISVESVWDNDEISTLALEVVSWLQVCSIPRDSGWFLRLDNSSR